jgi:hypothetical protein
MNNPRLFTFRWGWPSIRTWLVLTPLFLIFFGWWQWRSVYPFGREHCCDKQLYLSLLNYAEMHDGNFPTGGATPEASLSLLYPAFLDAQVLRGKGYSEEAAAKLLDAGKPLTPETCGWHYVDGLKTFSGTKQPKAFHRIAIFWDKIGLGHNSERLRSGGHNVYFLSGHSQIINETDWPRFLTEQQIAVAAIKRGEDPPPPWLPDTQ